MGYGLTKIDLLRCIYRLFVPRDSLLPYSEWFVDEPWFLGHFAGRMQLVLDTGFITHEFVTKRICQLGHTVIGMDNRKWKQRWDYSNFVYLRGDLTEPLPFAKGIFDIVFSPSLIEHLGLGYYGDKIQNDADIVAVREFSRILRPNGILLMQVPFGSTSRVICGGEASRHNEDKPFYRIYTHDTLGKLLVNFVVEEVSYARFYQNRVWQITDEVTACQIDWTQMPTQCIVRVKARKPV